MADGKVEIQVALNAEEAKKQAASLGKELGNAVKSGAEGAGSTAKAAGQGVGEKLSEGVSEGAKTAADKVEKTLGQKLSESGKNLEKFGDTYSKAVSLPIAAVATASAASAIKVDTALTGVRKTLDATETEYQGLKDAAIEFSKTNAVDPAQILDVQALGAQLGYSIDNLQLFGEVVSGLDIATDMNAEEAAMELAQFANIMGMAQTDTDRYGSTIVDLGNNFATTESDISHMAMRIAGAGKQLNMSEADVLGMATALSSMGIKAEAGGSAISTIMSNIDKEVATNGEHLEVWAEVAGVSIDQFKQMWGTDVVSTLQTVLTNMNDAAESGESMSATLSDLGINAIRQTDTLKRLANGGDMLTRAVGKANTAWEENTALTREVNNRNESMESRLKILWNQVQAVAIEVGGPLVEALISMLEAGEPILEVVANLAESFANADEGTQRAIISFGAAVAALGPVSSVTGKAQQAMGKLADAFKKNYDAALKAKTGGEQVGKGLDKARDGADKAKKSNTDLKKSNDDLQKSLDNAGKKAKDSGDKVKKAGDNAKTAAKNTDNLAGASKDVATASKDVAKQSATAATGLKNVGTQATAGSKALTAVKTAAGMAKTALLTVAPAVAITALATLAAHIMEVNERAKKVKEGTSAMTNALKSVGDTARDSAERTRAAADEITSSLNETSFDGFVAGTESVNDAIDKMIERHQDAANAVKESYSAYAESTGMLDTYMQTINDLTNKVDENGNKVKLTAEEQAKLQWAVDGVNGVLDTSYSVIDAENGMLDTSTELININAQAWRDRAKAAADQEALKTAMAEQMKAAADEEIAFQKLQDVFDEYGIKADAAAYATGKLTDDQIMASRGTSANAFEWAKVMGAVNEAKDAYESASKTLDDSNDVVEVLNKNVEESAGALSRTQSALAGWISATGEGTEANQQLAQALKNADVDIDGFTKSLENMGIGTQDLARVMKDYGEQGANDLVEAYKNGGEGLKAWAEQYGVEVPESYAEGTESGIPKVEDSIKKMGAAEEKALDENTKRARAAAGKTPEEIRAEIDARSKEVDLSAPMKNILDTGIEAIDSSVPIFGARGKSLTEATVLEMGAVDPSPQLQAWLDKAGNALELGGNRFKVVGSTLMVKVGEGYQEVDLAAITDEQTAAAIQAMLDQTPNANYAGMQLANEQASGASSVDMGVPGDENTQEYLDAMKSRSSDAFTTAQGVANSGNSGAGSVSYFSTGSDKSIGTLIAGMRSKISLVGNAGMAAANEGKNKAASVDYTSTGEGRITQFGNGMGNKREYAGNKAKAVATSAESGLRSGERSASTWGSHLGGNFASGVGSQSVLDKALSAARSVMNTVASVLKFSVPKAGPFSGQERGGETSGRHLVQNFAQGMASAEDEVRDAARSVAEAAHDELDGIGADIADSIVVDFLDVDPMAQLTASIKGGVSVAQMVTAASMVPSVTNNTQTVQFNQPVQSPDEIARTMRMQQRYGLAGRR